MNEINGNEKADVQRQSKTSTRKQKAFFFFYLLLSFVRAPASPPFPYFLPHLRDSLHARVAAQRSTTDQMITQESVRMIVWVLLDKKRPSLLLVVLPWMLLRSSSSALTRATRVILLKYFKIPSCSSFASPSWMQ
jgi:hypothetical protein